MNKNRSGSLSSFLEEVEKYNAHQPEYHQAVREVFTPVAFLEKSTISWEQSLLDA